MRILVFLLVLANLLFLAFSRGYLGSAENPDGERLKQQLQPERIVVVSKGEPAAAEAPVALSATGGAEVAVPAAAERKLEDKKPEEKKAEEKKPEEKKADAPKAEEKPATACLAWPDLSTADAERLAELAKSKFPGLSVSRSVAATEGGNHWVYIPPLASKADAERKAGELKKLGVTEFFIVGESGPNQYAISLGLFSSEQGAKDQLEALKGKGVRSAKVGQRGGKPTSVRLEVKGDAVQVQHLKDTGSTITATPAACEGKPAAKK